MLNQNLGGKWSFLIVLDACRFDKFHKIVGKVGLKGTLEKVWSLADNTVDWYRLNWSEKHPDICILTSHPWIHTRGFNKNFGECHILWEDPLLVDPSVSLKIASKYIDQSNLNRFLIHLIPPHLPYIGEEGYKLYKELKIGIPNFTHAGSCYSQITDYGRAHGWERIVRCYEESLQIVLEALKRNKEIFKGEIIITSDHGEVLGENNGFGHKFDDAVDSINFQCRDLPVVYEVPWFQWRPR